MTTKQLRDDALAWINAYQPASLSEAMLLEQLRQVCEWAAAAEKPNEAAPRAQGWPDGMDEMAHSSRNRELTESRGYDTSVAGLRKVVDKTNNGSFQVYSRARAV